MQQSLATLETSLAWMPAVIGTTPKAILMVSGHWKTTVFAVMSSENSSILCYYNNLPPETCKIVYPARGAPELAPRRDEGVLIVGSGLSYHNLRLFGPGAKTPSAAFDVWLADSVAKTGKARTDAMLDWESAPHASICHAQEDHLIPLFAVLGAAEDDVATMV